MLIHFTGNPDTDDILQEVWLKIFRSLHQFNYDANLKTWMIRIVINTAKSSYRKQTNKTSQEAYSLDDGYFDEKGHWDRTLVDWDASTPEDLLARDELCQILDATMKRLPDMQHQALVLNDIEGVKLKEICNILETSASNVRVQLHRARQQLLLAVNRYYEGGL